MKPPVELSEESLLRLSREQLVALLLEQAAIVRDHCEILALLLEQNDELKSEIQRLKQPPAGGGKAPPTPPPDWAKANVAPKELKPRRKRSGSFVRHRAKPTHEVQIACDNCPDCGRRLSGGTESSRRQIVDFPEIKVKIVDFISISQYCGVCKKSYRPATDFSRVTVGKSCFSQRVHAFTAYLRQECRLPIRQISALLSSLCHIRVSIGEVDRMLATVAALGKPAYNALLKDLRGTDTLVACRKMLASAATQPKPAPT